MKKMDVLTFLAYSQKSHILSLVVAPNQHFYDRLQPLVYYNKKIIEKNKNKKLSGGTTIEELTKAYISLESSTSATQFHQKMKRYFMSMIETSGKIDASLIKSSQRMSFNFFTSEHNIDKDSIRGGSESGRIDTDLQQVGETKETELVKDTDTYHEEYLSSQRSLNSQGMAAKRTPSGRRLPSTDQKRNRRSGRVRVRMSSFQRFIRKKPKMKFRSNFQGN